MSRRQTKSRATYVAKSVCGFVTAHTLFFL